MSAYTRQDAADVLAECITAAGFADRVGVTRTAVINWAERYIDFPAPVWVGRAPLYWLPELDEWHARFKDGRAGVTIKQARRAGTLP